MRYLFISVAVILSVMVFSGSQKNRSTQPQYPTDIKETYSHQFLVTNKGDKTVVLYTPEFDKPVRTWEFEDVPTGIATRGNFAYITTSGTDGEVHFLNLKTRKVVKKLTTGAGANTPLISPDGKTLYVLNQFENTVTQIDLKSQKIVASEGVLREPACAVIDSEGKYLFVSNFLPAGRADLDTVAARVSVIELDGFKKVKDIKLANGSNALTGITLSPDEKYVFVTHTLARFGLPTNQLLQGWMNTSAMSIIDVTTLEKAGTVLLDDPERGAGGVWGINSSADKIVITHSGTHEISVIDYPAFLEKFNLYTNKNSLNYDLTFMHGIRQRIPLIGNGPRNFVISGDKAFIITYFSDILNVVNLDDGQIQFVALNENRLESQIDHGKRIFHDAAFCFQNWQSCNSCHPGDGRTDGLNWDLLNDGVGNPKNTKSLLYSHVTPPSMISGIREKAEMAVRAGFTHIQFAEISEDHALYVDKYLQSLRPVPSPWLVNGKLSEKAERGKKVFENLGCGDCHSGTYYTNMKMYRIGDDIEFEKGWDTPTLVEVWRTAPYLFDGRAATMKDVYEIHKHGIGKQVSEKEIDELVEYVNSL
ncbi:MAG: YVTN family beta-propeller repeat-containing protein [Bacteroidales bacterium]